MPTPQLRRVTATFEPSFATPIEVAISVPGEARITVHERTVAVFSGDAQRDLLRALAAVRPWEPFEPQLVGCDGIRLRATVQTNLGTHALESWSPTLREEPRAYQFFTQLLDSVIALPLGREVAASLRGAREFFELGLPVERHGVALAFTASVPEHLGAALVLELEQLMATGVQVIDLRLLQTLPSAVLDSLVRHPHLRFCAAGTLLNALTERGVASSRCFGSEVEAAQAASFGDSLLELKQRVLARVRGLPGVVSLRLEASEICIVVKPAGVAAVQAVLTRDFATDPVRIEAPSSR